MNSWPKPSSQESFSSATFGSSTAGATMSDSSATTRRIRRCKRTLPNSDADGGTEVMVVVMDEFCEIGPRMASLFYFFTNTGSAQIA